MRKSTRLQMLYYRMSMKLSVSLPDKDVAFLDEYAQQQGIESRSAALQRFLLAELEEAIRLHLAL